MFHLLPNLIADPGSVTWHQIPNLGPCLLPPAGTRVQECTGKEGWQPTPSSAQPCPPSYTDTDSPDPRVPAKPHSIASLLFYHSLRAAPHVQPDRWGPGCSGWGVAMASKHSAPRSPCVWRVTHRTPVGVDSRSLLPQVSALSLFQLQ